MISLILAFLIELIALVSYGYLGAALFGSPILRAAGALAGMGVMGMIWGRYFSPKAHHRLTMPGILFGKLLVLMMPAYLLIYGGDYFQALGWIVIVVQHLLISARKKQI